MSLKSSKPEYRVQLPLSKKRVAFTAFTMRTERTLMLASQTNDTAEITAAVVNCINDHIRTDGIKAEDLPQAEAELLLLNMRAKSVGETVDLVITDPQDQKTYDAKVNLTEITVTVDEEFTDLIELSDNKMLKMEVPGMTALGNIAEGDNDFDTTIKFLVACVSQIIDGEECINRQDISDEDITDFILDLDSGDFGKINDQFFNRIPKLSTIVKVKRADGTILEVPVEGIASFL